MKHQSQGGAGGKPDFRLHAPAYARNRDPILQLIQDLVAADATVLEVGSGSGEHAVYVAQHMPELTWQPSDPDPTMRASIEGWIEHAGAGNVRPPLAIDCAADDWWSLPDAVPDLIIAINFTHIVTQPVIDGLLTGAGRLLRPGGLLALYGPFRFNGDYTSQSNKSFDIMLAQQNREWGLRDLNNIAAAAAPHGLELKEIVAMPSNNHTLVLKRG
jgi:cyclopropane fatty-acyl-phospholipid synthase-like methyltransferase